MIVATLDICLKQCCSINDYVSYLSAYLFKERKKEIVKKCCGM